MTTRKTKRAPRRAAADAPAAVAADLPPAAPAAAAAPCLLASLGIRDVAAAAAALRAALAAGAEELDVAPVTQIDTAGVQLLVCARRTAADAGRALRLTGAGPVLIEAANRLGVAAVLGLPPAA